MFFQVQDHSSAVYTFVNVVFLWTSIGLEYYIQVRWNEWYSWRFIKQNKCNMYTELLWKWVICIQIYSCTSTQAAYGINIGLVLMYIGIKIVDLWMYGLPKLSLICLVHFPTCACLFLSFENRFSWPWQWQNWLLYFFHS